MEEGRVQDEETNTVPFHGPHQKVDGLGSAKISLEINAPLTTRCTSDNSGDHACITVMHMISAVISRVI